MCIHFTKIIKYFLENDHIRILCCLVKNNSIRFHCCCLKFETISCLLFIITFLHLGDLRRHLHLLVTSIYE